MDPDVYHALAEAVEPERDSILPSSCQTVVDRIFQDLGFPADLMIDHSACLMLDGPSYEDALGAVKAAYLEQTLGGWDRRYYKMVRVSDVERFLAARRAQGGS